MKDPRIFFILKINNIKNLTNTLNKQLDHCQNALSAYLKEKRNAFARFYFLSDDDLLELLGQFSAEHILQKHIRKIFPGVKYLGLIKEGNFSHTFSVLKQFSKLSILLQVRH